MAQANERLDLIRLRAKHVARLDKRLRFTRDAYREALGSVAESLAEYELAELSPDQDPAAVLDDIRRLALRRGDLEATKIDECKAIAEQLEGARLKLTDAIFDEQLELFPALDGERKAADREPDAVRLRVDDRGRAVPIVEPAPDPEKRPRRGKRKPPPRTLNAEAEPAHDPATGEVLA